MFRFQGMLKLARKCVLFHEARKGAKNSQLGIRRTFFVLLYPPMEDIWSVIVTVFTTEASDLLMYLVKSLQACLSIYFLSDLTF